MPGGLGETGDHGLPQGLGREAADGLTGGRVPHTDTPTHRDKQINIGSHRFLLCSSSW